MRHPVHTLNALCLCYSNVFVVHVLEHPEFPVSPLCVYGRLERTGQLLDGNLQVGTITKLSLAVGGTANLKERKGM